MTTASSTYSLNQVMLWWPWLLMGQAPGFPDLEHAGRQAALAGGVQKPVLDGLLIQRAHPELLGDPAPWTGYVSLWTEYPKLRQPAKP